MIGRTVAVVAAALFLAGCAGQRLPSFVPVPVSSLTAPQVYEDARAWVARDPANREWATVTATGSMKPFIDEFSVVLLERTNAQTKFQIGEPVVFNRGDAPRVLHVIADQTETHVYLSGFNNRQSDRWFPKSSISSRVVGQLYSAR